MNLSSNPPSGDCGMNLSSNPPSGDCGMNLSSDLPRRGSHGMNLRLNPEVLWKKVKIQVTSRRLRDVTCILILEQKMVLRDWNDFQ